MHPASGSHWILMERAAFGRALTAFRADHPAATNADIAAFTAEHSLDELTRQIAHEARQDREKRWIPFLDARRPEPSLFPRVPIIAEDRGPIELPVRALPEPLRRELERALSRVAPEFRSALAAASADARRSHPDVKYVARVPRTLALTQVFTRAGEHVLVLPRGVNRSWLVALFANYDLDLTFRDTAPAEAHTCVAFPALATTLTIEQEAAVRAALLQRSACIVGEPAGGKTLVGIHLLARLGLRTLIIVPSTVLCQQWMTQLRRSFGPHADASIEPGRPLLAEIHGDVPLSVRTLGSITVMLAPTFAQLPRDGDGILRDDVAAEIGCVIVDENHTNTRSTAWHLHTYPGRVYGLTATDERADGTSILLPATYGAVVPLDATTHVPLRAEITTVPFTFAPQTFVPHAIGRSGRRTTSMSWQDAAALRRFQEYDERYLRACLEALVPLLGTGAPVLIDAVTHATQQRVQALLAELLPSLKTAIFNDRTKDANAVLAAFERGELHIIIGSHRIREGVDFHRAEHYVLLRPLTNRKELTQKCGRLSRPTDEKRVRTVHVFGCSVRSHAGRDGIDHRLFTTQQLLEQLGAFVVWHRAEDDHELVHARTVPPAPAKERTCALEPIVIPRVLRHILAKRGIVPHAQSTTALRTFLTGALTLDPAAIPGLLDAVAALREYAVATPQDPILLWTDYDVDGFVSGAIIGRTCAALGLSISHVTPNRRTDGYGLGKSAWERLVERTGRVPKLLITTDCGTTSGELIGELLARETRVIVIDHHEMQDVQLPAGCILVNPKRLPRAAEHERALSSTGLAWAIAHAVEHTLPEGHPFTAEQLLPEAALGTVADVVSLGSRHNRALIRSGLAQWNDGSLHVGLQALADITQRFGRPSGVIDERTLGYHIAPVLNAPGRLVDAADDVGWVYELLTTDDPARARELAERAVHANDARRNIERAITIAARETASVVHRPGNRVLVVAGEGWHRGVIGIVAGRLREEYGLPTFVGDIDTELGLVYVSARSVPGFDLMEILKHFPRLISGGGHAMAAGGRIPLERFNAFRTLVNAYAAKFPASLFGHHVTAEASMMLEQIDVHMLRCIHALHPYGEGNPRPRVQLGPLEVLAREERLYPGADAPTTTLRLAQASGSGVHAQWGSPEPPPAFLAPGHRVNVIATIHLSTGAFRRGELLPVLVLRAATLAEAQE